MSLVICPLRKRKTSAPVRRNFARPDKSKSAGRSPLNADVIGNSSGNLNPRDGARNRPKVHAALHHPLPFVARGRKSPTLLSALLSLRLLARFSPLLSVGVPESPAHLCP